MKTTCQIRSKSFHRIPMDNRQNTLTVRQRWFTYETFNADKIIFYYNHNSTKKCQVTNAHGYLILIHVFVLLAHFCNIWHVCNRIVSTVILFPAFKANFLLNFGLLLKYHTVYQQSGSLWPKPYSRFHWYVPRVVVIKSIFISSSSCSSTLPRFHLICGCCHRHADLIMKQYSWMGLSCVCLCINCLSLVCLGTVSLIIRLLMLVV